MAWESRTGLDSPRVLAALWLAAMLHALCLGVLTLQMPALPAPAQPMFDVEFTNTPVESADLPDETALDALASKFSAPAASSDETPAALAAPTVQQPAHAQLAPAPEPPKTEPKAAESKTAVTPLPPLPGPTMAFDESKTTKEQPKEAYLSDRTSTAANRGPKDLKRGDPYLDKGQSDVVRALQKRGEGNLPAIPSDASSGSVKREGTPDAGKQVATEERTPKTDITKQPNTASLVTATRRDQEEKEGKAAVAETQMADMHLQGDSPEIKRKARVAEDARLGIKTDEIAGTKTPTTAQADSRLDELEKFRAQLEGNVARAGNAEGDKPGVRGRIGEKGHEGDGTPRPGHSEAVSDVNTLNLDSSAAEFDEARFAKIKDPVATYFKPLFRRIDAQWKREIVARNRTRFLRGVVRMKIVMRKDGQLKEATEVSRLPSDLPDEYAAIAKLAIERAAEKSEPFPAELNNREALDITVGFIY